MPGRQRPAIVAEHDALEQIGHGRPRGVAADPAVGGQDGVSLIPQLPVDDRRMLGRLPLLLVAQFAEVGAVVEELDVDIGTFAPSLLAELDAEEKVCDRRSWYVSAPAFKLREL